MTTSELNRRVVLDYFERAFVCRDPERAAELLSADYRHHGAGSGSGREDFIAYFADFFARTPNFGVRVLQCVADDFGVALRVEARVGELRTQVAEFYRLEGGRIREHWHVISAGA